MEIVTSLLSFHTYRGNVGYPKSTFISVQDLNEKTEIVPQFVWYYAVWCGHCKKLQEKWAKLEEYCKGKINVELKGVDCEELPSLQRNANVKGYPTLILHTSNKEPVEYKGNRELDDFVEFLEKNI